MPGGLLEMLKLWFHIRPTELECAFSHDPQVICKTLYLAITGVELWTVGTVFGLFMLPVGFHCWDRHIEVTATSFFCVL
jgi:hypothetical protein